MGKSTLITHAEALDETLAELLAEWPEHLRQPPCYSTEIDELYNPLFDGETPRDYPFPNHDACEVYAFLAKVLAQLKLDRARRQPKLKGRQKVFVDNVLRYLNDGLTIHPAITKAAKQSDYSTVHGYTVLKRLGIKFRRL